jgi:hypothetical protein
MHGVATFATGNAAIMECIACSEKAKAYEGYGYHQYRHFDFHYLFLRIIAGYCFSGYAGRFTLPT